jgi:UDP-glucose:(heptosyl)LPS alpha-1,3-glucosyltransferase
MRIAFCYGNVVPARGGCETYIVDLARRLVADGQEVHLLACTWDDAALPQEIHVHRLPEPRGPRFLRPWRFSTLCRQALAECRHDVSIGFDKVLGPDILYPQGGLQAASASHNANKFASRLTRGLAWLSKQIDPAHRSFAHLERKAYNGTKPPVIVVASEFVRSHFQHYLGIPADLVRVVPNAIHPERLSAVDRPRRRLDFRQRFGIGPAETVGMFCAMNYRLKGIEPLLYAVRRLVSLPQHQPAASNFRLLVIGDPRYQRWENLAKRLGIAAHLSFAGHCADIRNGYFAADFVVQPSFYDPCSLVVLEALACSLPVISSRTTGASEFLKPPREGYVVTDPHDCEQLAWCMGQLLDPQRRAACGKAALETARRWTFEDHYTAMRDIFHLAAQQRRAA